MYRTVQTVADKGHQLSLFSYITAEDDKEIIVELRLVEDRHCTHYRCAYEHYTEITADERGEKEMPAEQITRDTRQSEYGAEQSSVSEMLMEYQHDIADKKKQCHDDKDRHDPYEEYPGKSHKGLFYGLRRRAYDDV